MLPFIRRSDLTAFLHIQPTDTPKVWKALQYFKRELPPPVQTIDDSVCELSLSLSLSSMRVIIE
jgi:hypothetical protein